MSAFEATFGSMECHIRVEPRSNERGEMLFAATPFVINCDRNLFNWFPDSAGAPIEFLARGEDAALARAATFLTVRFGSQHAQFVTAPERSTPVVLKPLASPTA